MAVSINVALVDDTITLAMNIMICKAIITKSVMKILSILRQKSLNPTLKEKKSGNHFIAINVAKLAQRNTTSQCENPLRFAISIFSASL